MSGALLFGVLAFALTAPLPAQEKFAVLVGVDDYIEFGEEFGGDLQGAERDALLMREVLLERWGVAAEDVRTLLSRQATKDAIREAITGWLSQRVGPEDLAIFYFAGHGSQAYDLDGDEPDGLDETLAPTDVAKLSSANDIRDDELREWLGTIRGEVVVILDSCHSGSATRGSSSMRPRILDRALPSEGGREPERVRQQYDPESMADGSRSIIEVAAAAPNQSAMEGDFEAASGEGVTPGGAFTRYLVRELWQAPPTRTYAEVVARVASQLKAEQFTQDPQLDGPSGEALFSIAQSKSIATASDAGSVRVLSATGTTATLAGGEVQGVTVGSEYRTRDGARLEVTRVDVDRATATILEGRPSFDDVATLERAAIPAVTLTVDVPEELPGLRANLERALADFTDVDLGANRRAPDLTLAESSAEGRVYLLGRDLGTRAVVSGRGAEAPTAEAASRAVLKELAMKRLASLDNPAASLSIELEVSGDAGSSQGDRLRVSVSTSDGGHLTLMHLDPGGGLELLWPTPDKGSDPLGPGERVVVQAGSVPSSVRERAGLGLVLAIVSRAPLLESSGADSGPRLETIEGLTLIDQVRRALDSLGRTDPATGEEWASSFVVYQRPEIQ